MNRQRVLRASGAVATALPVGAAAPDAAPDAALSDTDASLVAAVALVAAFRVRARGGEARREEAVGAG